MEFEKYDIDVPARIEVISANEARNFFLRTASISAREVFFHTDEPLPENSPVNMDLILNFTRPGKSGRTILINVTGTVAKSDPSGGMTIILNEDYQITKLRAPATLKNTSLCAERVY
ncbi:MAG: hypothetical protein L7F78_00655 [Syntrophales bacterium LBB04]|nr:hypothetical protein [Syntrophales bacterium LBB04]